MTFLYLCVCACNGKNSHRVNIIVKEMRKIKTFHKFLVKVK